MARRRDRPGAAGGPAGDASPAARGEDPDAPVLRVRGRRRRDRVRSVVLGDERRVGLWIFPIVLVTGLAAAVLATAVTVLVYAQRVDALREEVGGAAAAADVAESEIAALVEQARADLGLVEGSEAADAPGVADPTDRVFPVGRSAADGSTAVGSAFPFFSDEGQTFLVTAAAVVGDASAVEVYLPQGVVRGQVTGVDAEHGLAVVRVDAGGIPPLPWRPAGDPVARDAAVRVQGVGGPDTPVVVEGRVAGAGQLAIAVEVATTDYLRGAPVLDQSGQVVAVVVAGYRPYGVVGGTLAYLPPIRALCVRLVQCAPEDLGGLPPLPPAATPQPAPVAGTPRQGTADASVSPAAPAPAPAAAPPVPAPAPAPPPPAPDVPAPPQPPAPPPAAPSQPPAPPAPTPSPT